MGRCKLLGLLLKSFLSYLAHLSAASILFLDFITSLVPCSSWGKTCPIPPALQSVNLGPHHFLGPLKLVSLTGIVDIGGSSQFFLWIQHCRLKAAEVYVKKFPPAVSPNAREMGVSTTI